ncbi:M20 metallopeptidase family protein [Nocardioides mesophilus]|uniref:Amidohydrolase n=1 Tax=Nocardioides mesophilus TaxID=433659 RepID=A0A7G9RE13_9ACTN|nr:M20 family metallopeptidase [Nocardioides mesophilus]QNN53838.1 amidohydrolase [Nocardioides mesophilus]
MSAETVEIAQQLGPDLVTLRRRLHRIPEIGLHLPKTQQLLLEELAGLDVEVHRGRTLSSLTVVLRGRATRDDGSRGVVLLRGDMDALPVAEEVASDHASEHEGVMHACGHDLHMAALVGAARILHRVRDRLAGDVVLMFQPGEEGPGGAEPMLAEGLLDVAGARVEAAYALHVMSSEHPAGQWFARPGPLFAAADEVHVRVLGSGGHGSAPHRAKDPIPAACEMVLALQAMKARTADVFDPVVVNVGLIAAGTKENIIPDEAYFEATVRTLSEPTRARVHAAITRTVSGIAAAHDLEVEVEQVRGYPVTVNDEAEYALAHRTVLDLFGAARFTTMPHPDLGAEDMAFVLREVPGAYFNLGACPGPDPLTAPDNHSPRAAFDDSVLPDAAAWLAEVALRRLAGA